MLIGFVQVHAVREAGVSRHQGRNARLECRECNERVRRQVASAVRAAEGGVEQQEQAIGERKTLKQARVCVHVTRQGQ